MLIAYITWNNCLYYLRCSWHINYICTFYLWWFQGSFSVWAAKIQQHVCEIVSRIFKRHGGCVHQSCSFKIFYNWMDLREQNGFTAFTESEASQTLKHVCQHFRVWNVFIFLEKNWGVGYILFFLLGCIAVCKHFLVFGVLFSPRLKVYVDI